MVTLPLLDAVMNSQQTSSRSGRVVAQLIEFALKDLEQVEKLDESLSPSEPSQFDRQMAALVRGLYDQWAREAEALLDRIASLERRAGQIAGSEALRDAHGRIRAMLSISLDDLEESRRQLASGRTVPIAEVRRELRLGIH